MKQVQRMSKSNSFGVMDAIGKLIDIIDGYTVKNVTWKIERGVILLVNEGGAEFGATVWTDGSDFYATPDWMLDWADYEWWGVSAGGNDFTIFDGEPKKG